MVFVFLWCGFINVCVGGEEVMCTSLRVFVHERMYLFAGCVCSFILVFPCVSIHIVFQRV